MDKDEAPKHFPKPKIQPKKIIRTAWRWATGVIQYSFMKPSETITTEKYCKELDEIHRKPELLRPTLVKRKETIFVHKTLKHITKVTLLMLNELGDEAPPHPPYSLDLSPTDYHFFKHLDNCMRGKIFQTNMMN
ncbi:hypothetical protein RB195_010441 [Necator americanus]|uniref:Histone-lysine N-methyltransferase SETMAR n=1 Tax=Necator americanus TaxID=51031 RepID=A0ABR1CZ79_NECAM